MGARVLIIGLWYKASAGSPRYSEIHLADRLASCKERACTPSAPHKPAEQFHCQISWCGFLHIGSGQFENSDGFVWNSTGSLPGGKRSSSARAEGVADWCKIRRSSSLPRRYRSSRRGLGVRNSSPVSAPDALARTALAVIKDGSYSSRTILAGYPQRIWLRRMVASIDVASRAKSRAYQSRSRLINELRSPHN